MSCKSYGLFIISKLLYNLFKLCCTFVYGPPTSLILLYCASVTVYIGHTRRLRYKLHANRICLYTTNGSYHFKMSVHFGIILYTHWDFSVLYPVLSIVEEYLKRGMYGQLSLIFFDMLGASLAFVHGEVDNYYEIWGSLC